MAILNNMFFYEVLLASNKYHGQSALTYYYLEKLEIGQLVQVPLGKSISTGVISKIVVKPIYKTKAIDLIFENLKLGPKNLKLMNWMMEYYPSPLYSIVSAFIPNNILTKTNQTKIRNKTISNTMELPEPTIDQAKVINSIKQDKLNSTFFIHGDTGTGKTQIYIQIAESVLKTGKSCMVLTPEISLTPQLLTEFEKYISNPIYVIHSNLTVAQKRKIWIELSNCKVPVVVIGPRSVLFSPINNIGLVVIDECHEGTYKQEQFPKYHAIFVGAYIAKLHNCKLILGTATPTITDYSYFTSKKLPVFRLREKAISNAEKIEVKVINIKDRTGFSRNSFISDKLINELKHQLKQQKQSIVFLNKRGTARLISCDDCGWVDICPNCEIPLTLHLDNQVVRCHTCGYHKRLTHNCPDCKSTNITFKNIGSKSLFDNIKTLFPDARIQRFDSDSLKSEKLENNFDKVKNGEVDILVGTQILAKGLDLPNLALVGIVSADSNLSFPDYRSEENNYQLLTQIIGRVGRGHTDGTVVIQTLNPESISLKAAITGDWESFYKKQIIQRHEFNLPPYCFILKIIIQRKTMSSITSLSNTIISNINSMNLRVEIIGPSPRFNERAMGNFNWQIIVKSKHRGQLIKIIDCLPKNINYDLDPLNLL